MSPSIFIFHLYYFFKPVTYSFLFLIPNYKNIYMSINIEFYNHFNDYIEYYSIVLILFLILPIPLVI
jgi:hypothetical protein